MRSHPKESLIERLASAVGRSHVLADPQDTAPFITDWRQQYSAQAECVVQPASPDEVAQVVSLCAREGVAVVPQGGNTGLCGGSVPTGTRREVVLSLSRLNRIREIDPLNNTITVEAGCVLASIQSAAQGVGRLFPLSLGAEGSCQIGGNLSTNAGGVNVLRYGNAREQVLGLEVVLADGRIWNGLRALRKDNTGYDLKQPFLGAEGTLGVITAAVLKLYPRPDATATAWIAVESPRAAVELLAALRARLGDRLNAFELVSRFCVETVLARVTGTRDPLGAPHPWYVLADVSDAGDATALAAGVESALSECADAGALRDAALAHSESQAAAFWRLREAIPEAQFRNVKHDVSVPVSQVPAFIELASQALERKYPDVAIYAFGHIGDGNIHFNVGLGDPAANEALMRGRADVNEIVYDVVASLNGSISAEHGLGQLKREEIRRHKDPIELELMVALKKMLDPEDIMNPGKVV